MLKTATHGSSSFLGSGSSEQTLEPFFSGENSQNLLFWFRSILNESRFSTIEVARRVAQSTGRFLTRAIICGIACSMIHVATPRIVARTQLPHFTTPAKIEQSRFITYSAYQPHRA
jgi:hypothetical protein